MQISLLPQNMDYIFQDGEIDFVDRNNLLQDYINGDTVFENILTPKDVITPST